MISLKAFKKMQVDMKIMQDNITLLKERQEILVNNDVALKQAIDDKAVEKKEPTYFG